MELKTERLVLRRFRAEDAEDLYAYLSDPEVVTFEPYKPFTRDACELEAVSRAENPSFVKKLKVLGILFFHVIKLIVN